MLAGNRDYQFQREKAKAKAQAEARASAEQEPPPPQKPITVSFRDFENALGNVDWDAYYGALNETH